MSSPLDEAAIRAVVQAFYPRVRDDDLLAPIFALKIHNDDWPHHLDHITDFWSSIFLKTGRFTGNPMQKHLGLPGLTPAHFTRWLSLFKDTAETVLTPHQATTMYTMAQRIAQSLQMGLAFNLEQSGAVDHPFAKFAIKRPG